MKALKILKNRKEELISNLECCDGEYYEYAMNLLPSIDEAIKELEDYDKRDCKGCRHNDITLKQCELPYTCIRQLLPTIDDCFEPKDKQ